MKTLIIATALALAAAPALAQDDGRPTEWTEDVIRNIAVTCHLKGGFLVRGFLLGQPYCINKDAMLPMPTYLTPDMGLEPMPKKENDQ